MCVCERRVCVCVCERRVCVCVCERRVCVCVSSLPVCICGKFGHLFIANGAEVMVMAVVDEGSIRTLQSLLEILQGHTWSNPSCLPMTHRLVEIRTTSSGTEMTTNFLKPPN